jgi:hypothetical protein
VVGRFGGESARLLEPATSKCWRVTWLVRSNNGLCFDTYCLFTGCPPPNADILVYPIQTLPFTLGSKSDPSPIGPNSFPSDVKILWFMDDEWNYIQTDTTQRHNHNLHPGSFFTLRPRFSMHKSYQIELRAYEVSYDGTVIGPVKTSTQ